MSLLLLALVCLCVCVWQAEEEAVVDQWVYIGRIRSHSRPITGLSFGMSGDGLPLLASVGEDRRLVQYDLMASSVLAGVRDSQWPWCMGRASQWAWVHRTCWTFAVLAVHAVPCCEYNIPCGCVCGMGY